MRYWSSVILLLVSSVFGQDDFIRNQLYKTLDTLHATMEVQYAPMPVKKAQFDFDLEKVTRELKEKVRTTPHLSYRASQQILLDFFAQFRDAHVRVTFESTAEAALPFCVKEAEGRYFIVESDLQHLIGLEILTWDDRPIQQVVESFQTPYSIGNRNTDRENALFYLVYRSGREGHEIPTGSVRIVCQDPKNKKQIVHQIAWRYLPEKIAPHPRQRYRADCRPARRSKASPSSYDQYHMEYTRPCIAEHAPHQGGYELSNEEGFLGSFDRIFWKSNSPYFHAYIFQHPKGFLVGYLRIPHYQGGNARIEHFAQIIQIMEQQTKLLIIDQLNNAGGVVSYMYSILSRLTPRPLHVPSHKMAITQRDISAAFSILSAPDILIQYALNGYACDAKVIEAMRGHYQEVINQWNQGKAFTDPLYVYGIKEIQPNPWVCYSKPILLLINSLDYSCADFFPAILKDNGRAVLMGERTAGAGGFVKSVEYPNCFGIEHYNITSSLAYRPEGDIIENQGVSPDVEYQLSVNDLLNGFCDYKAAILEKISTMVK